MNTPIHKKIAELMVKHNLPTRQAFIGELIKMTQCTCPRYTVSIGKNTQVSEGAFHNDDCYFKLLWDYQLIKKI
jgi:hypothetical protein